MSFTSVEFLLFFFTAVVLYYILPAGLRRWLLLVCSLLFYISFVPWHFLVLAAGASVDYAIGRALERQRSRKLLVLGILSTCGFLLAFKYLDFATANLTKLAEFVHWKYSLPAFHILVPVGLSFQRLQSLGYVIDVYRRKISAERNFPTYMLYASFFPQVLSGPIERAHRMLPQFHENHFFEANGITEGLKRAAWGFFKKLVIADRLALIVSQVYSNPAHYEGLPLILGTIFFALQIYCDFSGYSDIAIGTARVFGIRLMENFSVPYAARTVSDFWRRWHISLSSWLRDYLFLPLFYSLERSLREKGPPGRWKEIAAYSIATLLTMFIAGLWHGPAWTYVGWGLSIGVLLSLSVITRRARRSALRLVPPILMDGVRKSVQTLFTFTLICLAWVIFRCRSWDDVAYVYTHFFSGIPQQAQIIFDSVFNFLFRHSQTPFDTMIKLASGQQFCTVGNLILALLATAVLIASDYIAYRELPGPMRSRRAVIRWSAYYALIMSILLFGAFENPVPFLYFQF